MASKLSASTLIDTSTVVASAAYSFTADYYKPVAVQAVWTSTTASFALTLQYSADGVNWSDFTTATTISNTSTNVMWDIATTKDALYWRVNSVRTSGTLTTLKIYVNQIERT